MYVDDIRALLTEARKARNTVHKEILQVALGEVQTEEARRGSDVPNGDVEKILRKLVKSNSETLKATDNEERRAVLSEEITVLESLLPKTLTEDEVVSALASVEDAIKEAKADGPATGIAMKHLKSSGAAVDGRTVSAAVRRIRGS